jgi:NAD(P)-dependent dehydrogenase (short-subunit alcohol dehydrogenase family)
MKQFNGKVAVVTGAASGMGRAFAERLASEGMRVVLADVEQSALDRAVSELSANGYTVRAQLTDVTRPEQVERLAQETVNAFGAVHVLCNNAGVNGGRGHARSVLSEPPAIWEASIGDWQWITGVNYFGVAYGIHYFLPIMLEQRQEAHVVNTASMAGVSFGRNVYGATKHAVVSMSESLYIDLHSRGIQHIGVTCLCPALVSSQFYRADRNRPPSLSEAGDPSLTDMDYAKLREAFSRGIPPSDVAERVLQAIRDNQFYLIVGGAEDDARIRQRAEALVNRRDPTARPAAVQPTLGGR